VNGFAEVVIESDLFDDWDQYGAAVREAAAAVAAKAGGRLWAGDPEFIVDGSTIRVLYRMNR